MKNVACNSTKQKLSTMIFGFTLLLMSVANVSFAKDVTLTWDPSPSPETDVAGYKIYYGTSPGTYTGTEANIGPSPIDFGNTTSATLVGLDDTKSHYFTVTAYNVKRQESAYANEVNSPAQSNDDSDGDGYAYSVDCDDYNAAINPGATDICGQVDQNCDKVIDACPVIDADDDGFNSQDDCNDNNPAINPGATDICGQVDQNCDKVIDACPVIDADDDGFNSQEDCNDNNPAINPGATDICGQVDQNCDKVIDACPVIDADDDGFNSQEDCNDNNPAINPGATDICGQVDQNCDKVIDACPADPINILSPKGGEEWSSSSQQTTSWQVSETPSLVDTVVIEYSKNDQSWKTLKTLRGKQALATNTTVDFPTTRKSKEIKVKVTVKNAQGAVMGTKNSEALTLTR